MWEERACSAQLLEKAQELLPSGGFFCACTLKGADMAQKISVQIHTADLTFAAYSTDPIGLAWLVRFSQVGTRKKVLNSSETPSASDILLLGESSTGLGRGGRYYMAAHRIYAGSKKRPCPTPYVVIVRAYPGRPIRLRDVRALLKCYISFFQGERCTPWGDPTSHNPGTEIGAWMERAERSRYIFLQNLS